MSQQAHAVVQAQQKIAAGLPQGMPLHRSVLQHAAINPAITPVHSGILQRCSGGVECEECCQKRLERGGMMQRAAVSAAPVNSVPPIVHDVLSSPGQSLDAGTRAFIEPRFGYDFSQVRVHSAVPKVIQTRLSVNRPGDKYEQEADQVAEEVMQMPECEAQREGGADGYVQGNHDRRIYPQSQKLHQQPEEKAEELQRQTMGEEDEETLQAKEPSGQIPEVTPELDAHINSIRGGGQPLPESTRAFFESRFGFDFSHVGIHTNARANETAASLHARAYTIGDDIVFGAGQYAPETKEGKRLLAHELTHTLQQKSEAAIRRRRLSGVEEESEEETIYTKRESAGLEVSPMKAHTFASPASERIFRNPAPPETKKELTPEKQTENITGRHEEVAWSRTSQGMVEEVIPGQRFRVMNFGVNKATLKKEHQEFLSRTVYYGTLSLDPMAKIMIIGHTDQTGSRKLNETLANRRARAVEEFLKSIGVRKDRIEAVTGKGFDEPISDNETVLGRAKNRRVEVLVTPWKPEKPVPKLIAELQQGMLPYVIRVENFSAAPFQDTVKRIVEEAFKPISLIQFDWEGKSTSAEAIIDFDDATKWSRVLGLTGTIYMQTFRHNQICKVKGDPSSCEKVFPNTADMIGIAIANTVAHEAGHLLSLDHVLQRDNYMWTPDLESLSSKKNKTFEEKILLQRTLQVTPSKFNDSQIVWMIHRIQEKRKASKEHPNVIEFQ